jgi:hypothetical protein
MAWIIEVVDGCAIVRMNTNKVNIQNNQFFADLHAAFDRLEREFNELPVVRQGSTFNTALIYSAVEVQTKSVIGIGLTVKRICASFSTRGQPLLR